MKIHVASPPQSLTSLWMHDLHTALCESPVTQSTISWFGEMMKPPKNLTLFESIVTKNQLTWLKYLEKIEKYLEQGLIKGFPKSPHASTMGPLFFFQVQSWRSSDHQRRQDRNGQDCLVFFSVMLWTCCEWFKSCWNNMLCLLSHGLRSKVCTQERHCRIPGGQFGTSEIYSDVVLIGTGTGREW